MLKTHDIAKHTTKFLRQCHIKYHHLYIVTMHMQYAFCMCYSLWTGIQNKYMPLYVLTYTIVST